MKALNRWRPALRIARRDARRAKGRSVLVIAMIALPVLGVGAADVIFRTFQLTQDQQLTRAYGAADVVLSDTGQSSIEQVGSVMLGGGWGGDSGERAGPAPDVQSVLPAGSRVVVDRYLNAMALKSGDRSVRTAVRALAYEDPMLKGIYRSVEGRPPVRAGEVSLTSALAKRLGVAVGDRLELGSQPGMTVVGRVESSSRADEQTTFVAANAFGGGAPVNGSNLSYLVDLQGQPTAADVLRANKAGYLYLARTEIPGVPVQQEFDNNQATVFTAVALIVGMALLEVVLLAGPAFAVGAKRQQRQLALLQATGAQRRDVGRVVLSSGLVLGAVGAFVGAMLAVGLAVAALPLLVAVNGDRPGPFEVRLLELGAIAAVGVGIAVLAALLPARNASRQDALAGLTGRRGVVRSRAWLPTLGAIAAVLGAAIAYRGALDRSVNTILGGSILAELGLVAVTPFLVGQVGRLGPLLPVAPRLALRDAARNRSRTAPAVSAVLAAVAGSVAVGTFVASQDRRDELQYTPQAFPGSVMVQNIPDEAALGRVVQAVQQWAPGQATAIRAMGVGDDGAEKGFAEVLVPRQHRCPADFMEGAGEAEIAAAERDPRCSRTPPATFFPRNLVGDTTLVAAIGTRTPPTDAVLEAGGVAVPAWLLDAKGHVTVRVTSYPPGSTGSSSDQDRIVVLRGAAFPEDSPMVSVFSPAAAAKVGVNVEVWGVMARPAVTPTTEVEDKLRAQLQAVSQDAYVYVERGYVSDYGLGLLALVVGSAVIVLGASSIATGLAAADGRADLATLAAVGASPGLRRRLAAFQSAVTAVLGTALGIVAGMVPALGLIRAINAGRGEGYMPTVIPWTSLAATALLVPLLAALAAAALTRSRLPLERRSA